MPTKRDALKDKHCRTCAMFHNPQGQVTGYCVAHPATVFVVGAMPVGNVLTPDKPQKVQHVLASYIPIIGEDDGCWEHKPAMELLN